MRSRFLQRKHDEIVVWPSVLEKGSIVLGLRWVEVDRTNSKGGFRDKVYRRS